MQFLNQYGLFLSETITLVIAILLIVAGVTAILTRGKREQQLTIKKLNAKYKNIEEALKAEILDKKTLKQTLKQEKRKKTKGKTPSIQKRRVFVLNFHGDIRASAVESLRREISAILTIASSKDEIVINLESGGGLVHSYGLAASQLQRIRDKKIHLTVCIDKIAASGGYLMACVANQILAAPFAIIGSIGVVMQLPNLNRLLKKHNVEYEMLTSGDYKRTLTVFGENTEQGRKKCQEDLENIHKAFKDYILQHRPQVNIEEVSTGEHWLANKAADLKLVDGLITSDDYLMQACQDHDVFVVNYEKKKTLSEKLSGSLGKIYQDLMETTIKA